MGMMRYVVDYNGMRYTMDAPEGTSASTLQAAITSQNKPAPAPPDPAAPTSQQRAFQTRAQAQREKERGFFGRAYDTLMGNELPVPEAYTPAELAARQREIAVERKKLAVDAARYDNLAKKAFRENQGRGAAELGASYIQQAEFARKKIQALQNEITTITRTGLKPPEAQTTRETISSTLRNPAAMFMGIPGAIETGVGYGLGTVGLPGAETLKAAGKSDIARANEVAEDVFGAPGESLKYDATAQLLADVGGGAGSVASFLVPGAAVRLAGAGKGLVGAARAEAVAKAARPLEYGLGTVQGAQQGIQDIQATEQRTGKVIPDANAFAAILFNAGLGATEVGVAGRIFERIPVAKRGAALDAVADVVRRGTAGRIDPAIISKSVSRALNVVESRAAGRIAVRGAEESLQEGLVQAGTNVIAKGLYDEDRDVTEGVAYSALIGGIVGSGLRGVTEVAQKALNRAEKQGVDPAVVMAEFHRLAGIEVAKVIAANPGMKKNDAVKFVEENAEALFNRASANIVSGTEGDVADFEEFDAGQLDESVGESLIIKPTAKQVKAVVPTIEQVFEDSALDFEEAYGKVLNKDNKLNAEQKKQAARIVLQNPNVDPYDAISSVLDRGLQLRGEKAPSTSRTTVTEAATAETAPVAVAPIIPPIDAVSPQAKINADLAPAPAPVAAPVAAAPAPVVVPGVVSVAVDNARGLVAILQQRNPAVLEKVTELHAQDLSAGEIAQKTGLDTDTVRDVRLGLGLPDQGKGTQTMSGVGSPADAQERAGFEAWRSTYYRQKMAAITKAAPVEAAPEVVAAPVAAPVEAAPVEAAPVEAAPVIEEEPTYTPQQIAENLDRFAMSEAQDRGFDPGMFREGAVDVKRGREFLSDQQILDAQGPEYLDAYKAGIQWAQERIADAQAAPTQAATKATPARAPKKVKATAPAKAKNAKQVKAVIKRKPGKTAAEKVLNMAQAEMDQTPEEDMIEGANLTPYDPAFETIRSKPGINTKRMAKMLGPQLYGDPTNMGLVCIKEVLQNSFDATRTAVDTRQIPQGKIEISVSDDGRTLTVKDNGIGMSPELLGGKFLEIAGTAKEGDKNAGGFGIAKMLFLYANKNIRVVTAREGRIAELNVTGEQLFDSLDDPNAAPDIEIRDFEPVDDMAFPDGHGTIIQLTIPEEAGDYKIQPLPRWLDQISSLNLSPLFANIDVTFQGRSYSNPETIEIGSNFPANDYTQFVGVKFPWGTAKVYVTKQQTDQKYGDNMHILSNGLWQFSSRVNKDPMDIYSSPVPYTFYVDMVPSVKPDQPGYPFNFNRQGFTDDAKADFGKIKTYIDALYAYKSRAGEATSFGSVRYFQPDGSLGPTIDLTPNIAAQDTAFTRVGEGDQITVGADGSLLVNGNPLPELTPDQLKSGIPSANELKIDPDMIDTNAVMVHDNTDVVIKSTGEKMSIPDFMRRQFGERFDQFMKFNGDTFLTLRNEVARTMGYGDLRNEAIGVSFDPEYRGVSIRLPFSGSFINPLVPKYGDGLRAGYGIFGTMVHELAHHKVRSHNANFPAEMQDILLNMEADNQFDFEWFKSGFADTIAADYADIVKLGVELFNGKNSDISIEYRGNRFTDGSGEQAPEGTGIGGTGDVRGPSGEGSTGEPLLGPAYESRRGTGKRGKPAGGTGGGAESIDAAVSVKLTKAQMRRLEEAAGIHREKLSQMQKRIARSRNAGETMSLAGKLMLMARNPDDSVNILTSLFNSVPPPALQALLAPLETADVVRLGKRAGMKNVARIDTMMRDEYIPYVNRIMQRASKLTEKWTDFTSRSPKGANAMSDVMFFSNMVNADPSLAPTAAAYMAGDPKLQDLLAQQVAEKDPKKKSTLKGQITTRRGEIQRVYSGGEDADGTIVYGWDDVPPQGKQIFREARDYYRADFQEHYRLLIQRIDDTQFEEEQAASLKAAVDKMFKDASERVIYFPMKRFGDYWVSVGKGKSSEFHMFESASEQATFIRQLRRDKETREIDFSKGKDTLRYGIRNKTADASAALKNILDLIEGGGASDVDLLKDHIFQMYLTALPEADMRRRFIHRQFKTGFSTDTLRTFASTAIASANQLGRLAYGYKFKLLIDQSYDETAGNPSKLRLDTITNEMEMRLENTMSPAGGFWQQAANFGAKTTFLFILSSAKSAVLNFTQLHVMGLPALSAEFGEKATFAMAARYTGQMLTGQRIASPFRNEDGDVQFQTPNFTTKGSAYIRGLRKTDPDRYEAIQKAWDYAQGREVTESTFSAGANLYERSNEPSGKLNFTQAVRQGDAAVAVQRATANSVNFMASLFHHTERIGREIMYMSAFELAYDRNLKQGMSPEEAGDAAMPLATELTNKAMFDFSNWNKSRAAKHPVGKLALQMRSYSFAMTSLLFRSFCNMVAFQRTKAERLAAARVFFGVGAMTTLYAGLRSSQFYALALLGHGLVKWVESFFDDDDDDEDEEIKGGYITDDTLQRELLKYADDEGRELSKKDMDFHIRSVWIPETFGPGGTMATALGLSDGAAAKLAKVADMGLPALAGIDISNSMALTSLWHPIDTKSDDPQIAFYEGLGRAILGPSASLVAAPFNFIKEANTGHFDRAIEAISPAFLRGFVKAERLKDEGLVIGKNRDIVLKDPSFYDTYTLATQSLGFSEAETSRDMQLDIKAGEIEKEISDEKTKLLDQRYRAVLDFNQKPNKENELKWGKVERDISIYNLNYPSNEISEDAKAESFQSKSDEAAERAGGLGYNPKIPIREPLAEQRAAELGQ